MWRCSREFYRELLSRQRTYGGLVSLTASPLTFRGESIDIDPNLPRMMPSKRIVPKKGTKLVPFIEFDERDGWAVTAGLAEFELELVHLIYFDERIFANYRFGPSLIDTRSLAKAANYV